MTHALVTGASGFIGSRLVRALVARGDRVSALVRPTSDRSALAELGVDFAVGDVTRPDSLEPAVADVDVVYHLAAMLKQPWHPDFLTTNADGVRNVAAACAVAPRPPVLVVVSSIAAAGPSPDGRARTEADPPAPVSLYGESKLRGEEAAAEHAGAVPITVVRPPIVFGEGDRTSLAMFRSVARGLHAVPPGDPPTSSVHVDDLAAALIAAADSGERLGPDADARPGAGIYFAAADESPTYSELGRLIAAGLGRTVRVVSAPRAAIYLAGAAVETVARLRRRPGILSRDKAREATAGAWHCATDKARTQLGFTPAPLAERLEQTARWYADHGWI